jgi:hypothetical protein
MTEHAGQEYRQREIRSFSPRCGQQVGTRRQLGEVEILARESTMKCLFRPDRKTGQLATLNSHAAVEDRRDPIAWATSESQS